jgi:hypothetical protein
VKARDRGLAQQIAKERHPQLKAIDEDAASLRPRRIYTRRQSR